MAIINTTLFGLKFNFSWTNKKDDYLIVVTAAAHVKYNTLSCKKITALITMLVLQKIIIVTKLSHS